MPCVCGKSGAVFAQIGKAPESQADVKWQILAFFPIKSFVARKSARVLSLKLGNLFTFSPVASPVPPAQVCSARAAAQLRRRTSGNFFAPEHAPFGIIFHNFAYRQTLNLTDYVRRKTMPRRLRGENGP